MRDAGCLSLSPIISTKNSMQKCALHQEIVKNSLNPPHFELQGHQCGSQE